MVGVAGGGSIQAKVDLAQDQYAGTGTGYSQVVRRSCAKVRQKVSEDRVRDGSPLRGKLDKERGEKGGRDQLRNNKQQSLVPDQSLTKVGTSPTNNQVKLHRMVDSKQQQLLNLSLVLASVTCHDLVAQLRHLPVASHHNYPQVPSLPRTSSLQPFWLKYTIPCPDSSSNISVSFLSPSMQKQQQQVQTYHFLLCLGG